MANVFERILVPVDGSEVAKRAAEKALALAQCTGIPVLALHVLNVPDLPSFYAYPGAIRYQEMHDFIQKEGQLYLDEIERLGNQMCVAVSKKLLEGHPAEEIIKETREGDLIVIGSKGRTGLDRLLMGSVAENVARHASCPVMIVK
ncbi:MAG: universal stress protein [Methanophagales archaeon ANME-1-THS]|nr:MAG: universal stress protein [Methanophagales archaeon ANME-1-THS]